MKEFSSQKEYYGSLGTKRVGVAVLFFDESGKLLIVKPNYKDGWIAPGGTVDKNESPQNAALREVKEEIGIVIKNLSLLCVEYKSATDERPDFIEFVFLGGTLNTKDIANIMLEKEELDEFKFVEIEEALTLLRTGLKRRLPIALEAMRAGKPVYTEF